MRNAGHPGLVLLAALLLAACAPEPLPADPAIWLVEGHSGRKAWLFGTIHGLERPAAWQTPAVRKALTQADTVMVEIAQPDDGSAIAETFESLAHSPGLPPLSQRVQPAMRKPLAEMLKRHRLSENRFSDVETWAAALMMARAELRHAKPAFGIDRAVIAETRGRRLVELEGAAGQLRIFDSLPEGEQRDLLEAVILDANALDGESADLAEAWRKGDMALITRETMRGMLADPELREALLAARNRRWARLVIREMEAGNKPFVAVGAAHLAGSDGLPALLAEQGLKVTRLR
ncbi:MAG: TraB/GumN family protein [Novosphingobium sp.]|nr:TraB/GumN family protein [Novosphingobium sp.]